MRRVRTPLTAWPAFADLMTILAVVGLTAAIVIAPDANDDSDAPQPEEVITALTERVEALAESDTQLAEEVEALTEQNARLRRENDELKQRIRFGAVPCLGTDNDRPRTLLRIVVNAGYRLERRWLPDDGGDPARLNALVLGAVAPGELTPGAFEDRAGAIYRHGDAENTFGGSCRFFVELEQGAASHGRFSQAVGVVSRYFLIANSSEVNRILAAG